MKFTSSVNRHVGGDADNCLRLLCVSIVVVGGGVQGLGWGGGGSSRQRACTMVS